ncbi:hypothetical protein QFC22_004600 [Naganishia vaughanmartiniae]|uniref:Uncharacterized protein n=1 Tax=Naganishia vaughanmartiniae TaxID=1424756 RepID=A0ACC2X2E5_9TREE|nr:hypothetical protein QFC22_004600 [Naganishia vaughanmartiniae]
MTIHSPHLCSLPGFHIPTIDDEPSRPITCREIRDDVDPYAELPSARTPSEEHHDGKQQHAQTQGHEGQAFPRGYPIQPHGAQWHAHNPPRDGGRVIYETTKVTANDALSSLSPHNVVVDPGPAKRRKSAKAAQADQMDDQSRKTWLAEQRAQKIAMREKLAVVEEKIKQARQELWNSRWDVRFVRRFGWVLGVDEAEYREWWEALIEEQEEENEKEREGRKMKV